MKSFLVKPALWTLGKCLSLPVGRKGTVWPTRWPCSQLPGLQYLLHRSTRADVDTAVPSTLGVTRNRWANTNIKLVILVQVLIMWALSRFCWWLVDSMESIKRVNISLQLRSYNLWWLDGGGHLEASYLKRCWGCGAQLLTTEFSWRVWFWCNHFVLCIWEGSCRKEISM